MDKRVFAVDPSHGRSTFHHQLDSKALGVLPNPADNNLVMVQTGSVFFELENLNQCVQIKLGNRHQCVLRKHLILH